MEAVRRVVLTLALVPFLAVACGGGDVPTPTGPSGPSARAAGEFLTRITEYHLTGEFARSYRELHPGHQELLSERQFVACGKRVPRDPGVRYVEVLDAYDVPLDVDAVPERKAKAVIIQIREGSKSGTPIDTYTSHAVPQGGGWRWILAKDFLGSIEEGRCPDGSRLPAS